MSEDEARPLGAWLQKRREELEISLEEAEEQTRIRARYLEALEAEDLVGLPNPVVASGFLRNYAAYLELDPHEAAKRYAAIGGSLQAEPLSIETSSPFATTPFQPVALHEMPGQRSRWWVVLGVVVILAVVALGLWLGRGYLPSIPWLPRFMAAPVPTPTATQSVANIPPPTATESATATLVPTTEPATTTTDATEEPTATLEATLTPTLTVSPSPFPTPTELVYTGIFLELVFTDTSWIQVTVDGVRQFQGELEEGTYRSWYGDERIELRVGNAGAVEVTVNGEKIGALGGSEEVVDRIFEIVDEQVSEATPTSGPTLPPEEATATVGLPSATPAAAAVTARATITPTQTITPTIAP